MDRPPLDEFERQTKKNIIGERRWTAGQMDRLPHGRIRAINFPPDGRMWTSGRHWTSGRIDGRSTSFVPAD